MKKIIAFAGSNSSTSINHALVSHLASTIENCDVTVLELTDYPLPMYGQEIEAKEGFPDTLVSLLNIIKQSYYCCYKFYISIENFNEKITNE